MNLYFGNPIRIEPSQPLTAALNHPGDYARIIVDRSYVEVSVYLNTTDDEVWLSYRDANGAPTEIKIPTKLPEKKYYNAPDILE